MSDFEHPYERRAKMLGAMLKRKKETIVNAIVPPGMRPPFTKQLTHPESMAFWTKHRYDSIGKQVLDNMTPESIMELDAALAQAGAGTWGASEPL